MNADAPVGVIGLGLMGLALAQRLMGAGVAVLGYDIDPVRRDALQANHGVVARSAAEIFAHCRAVVIAVYDGPQIEALLGERQQNDNRPTVICTTTCTPDEIIRIADLARSRGLAFVEAPISGTSVEVRSGAATALVAGDVAAIDSVGVLLAALCPRTMRVSKIGDASRTKLAINLVLQTNRAALAEGIALAECLGLDGQAFLTAARASAAYSRVMETKGAKMLARDYRAQSHISQTLKDTELILAEAASHGLELPVTTAQAGLLRRAIALEGPDSDSSAVIEAVRRPANDKDDR
jgi:3-hydroxyisobutyrate dehydrogenase-like beta-hydroxyacid dehydrogenase